MEEYFTKEQVIELLKEQREICGEAYYKKSDLDFQANIHDAIDEAPHPNFPAPIKAIPVEKVSEAVNLLTYHIDRTKSIHHQSYFDGIYFALNVIAFKLKVADGKYT